MFKNSIRLCLALSFVFSQLTLAANAEGTCLNKSGCRPADFEVTEKQLSTVIKKLESPKGAALALHKLRLLTRGRYHQPGKQQNRHLIAANRPAIETRAYGNIGVIICHDLSVRNADAIFNNSMSTLRSNQHIDRLVLDLRDCPQAEFGNVINISEQCLDGDDGKVTVDVSGWAGNHSVYQTFVQRQSDLYVRTIDRTANTINHQYFRRWPNTTANLPFAVLTNGNTFSGSEILVAALREHNRVQLFGQPTGGNCDCAVYMQAGRYVYRLHDEFFNSPNGNCIGTADGPCQSDAGIKPDVNVNDGQNAPTDDPRTDATLQKAIDRLQSQR
jgi:C-terminal processing protease CtpA/Prc